MEISTLQKYTNFMAAPVVLNGDEIKRPSSAFHF